MPGMDGFEVAEAISGYSKTKDIPIIFLSANNTDKNFITKGYDSGGIDYITKPVDADILLLKVKTFYRLYEQTKALTDMQEALKEEIEFRKRAENQKDEFISIASHELKTPLTSIKGFLQLLQRSLDQNDVETSKKFLCRTQTQVEKLRHLIADLLDISKMDSGKMIFCNAEFHFSDMLDNVIDVIRQTNPEYNIIKRCAEKIKVFGDETRIEQVVINFITNAIKYSPVTKEIEIDTYINEQEELVFRVKDYGIGIPKEKQDQLFNKFYRVEESSTRFQGLGMGLYICAEILKRHQSRFGVESELGKGSTFYFQMPLKSNNQ
jgi:two-component system sensor histidine kinase/response regulator